VTSPTPEGQLADLALRTAGSLAAFTEQQTPKRNDQRFLLAYLKRLERLLRGMVVLHQDDLHEPLLVIYRTVFEVWAHATYLALEQDAALARLKEQLDFENARMRKVFGVASTEARMSRKLPLSCLMDVLSPILRREEVLTMRDWTRIAYDTQYRTVSFHYVHGHLGSTVPHLDDSLALRTTSDPEPARHALAMSAALGCSLLIAASRSFEIDPEPEVSEIVPGLERYHTELLQRTGHEGNI